MIHLLGVGVGKGKLRVHFQGGEPESQPCSFLPSFTMVSTPKGKNLLLEEQILCFKSRPHYF